MRINFEIISCPEERHVWNYSALGSFGFFLTKSGGIFFTVVAELHEAAVHII